MTLDPLEIELRNLVTWRSLAAERGRAVTECPGPCLSKYALSDWRDAAALPKDDLVALVPEGIAADPAMLAGMARLLLAAPSADLVEACRYRLAIDVLRVPASAHGSREHGANTSCAPQRRWLRWPVWLRSPVRPSSRDDRANR